MANLNTYLNFDGNCEEAFNFYKSVFGGEYRIMRFKDTPPEAGAPVEYGDKIMHIAFSIGKTSTLMGSDVVPGFGPERIAGNNYTISVSPESEEEGRRIFDGLSAGGNVVCPYDKAFWGAMFGMTVDKFGIQWMVNYEANPQHK